MTGLMMRTPLNVSNILTHADRVFPNQKIVSVGRNGERTATTYRETARRCRQLATALRTLGVAPGDRVATLAWNDQRHFELYYAVPGIGGVIHTLNPRLTPDTLAFIVREAKDKILFFDPDFAPLAKAVAHFGIVETFVLLGDRGDREALAWDGLLSYDELVEEAEPLAEWPELDENSAAGLCYTSGTTGSPKGVLYSQRSKVLHALVCALPTNLNITERDRVVPVVPMFHVNAWGLPHVCPLVGARLVLPRNQLDGASLERLFLEENVTVAAGVPTLWQGLARQLATSGVALPALKRLMLGGAAMPSSLVDFFEGQRGIEMLQGWGMTETSPLCTFGVLGPEWDDAGPDTRKAQKLKQGRPLFGINMRLADGRDAEAAPGELLVKGPWIASRYFGSSFDAENAWFKTGDIAEFDKHSYLLLTDRAKDLIKSGGEWISSVDLEERAYAIEGIAQVAAIAIPDDKWGERPMLVIVPKPGAALDAATIRMQVGNGLASWQVPDRIEFAEQLPIGPTGKILKTVLRTQYG